MLSSVQFPLCLTALFLYSGQDPVHQFPFPHSEISLMYCWVRISLSLVTHVISLSALMKWSSEFLVISCFSAAALPSGGCMAPVGEKGERKKKSCRLALLCFSLFHPNPCEFRGWIKLLKLHCRIYCKNLGKSKLTWSFHQLIIMWNLCHYWPQH